MFFPIPKRVSDYLDYYRDIRTKYGKRYWDFDPEALLIASREFDDCDKQFAMDKRKANKLPAPDRIQVVSIRYPVSCGIQFSRMMATQVQRQVEERIGISDIHQIPATDTKIHPFVLERMCYSNDMLILSERENGLCCLYFLINLSIREAPVKLFTRDSGMTLFWIRCYDEDHPESIVDPMDEMVENLRFEICDAPPKSLPAFEEFCKDLPEFPLRILPKYSFWIYDITGAWATKIKKFYEEMIALNEKKVRRESKKQKVKKTKKPVPVIVPSDESLTFPDMIFTIEFDANVADDTVEDLSDLMNDLSEQLAKKMHDEIGFDFVTIDKIDDRHCDVAIDFGQCPPEAVELVIKELNANIAGMKSITLG